jgi:hypothetical protein
VNTIRFDPQALPSHSNSQLKMMRRRAADSINKIWQGKDEKVSFDLEIEQALACDISPY